jgi:photosystem II stability/assembly factor-like uncharacterized protein
MKNWIRLACLMVGTALAFGSAAESEQASGSGTTPSVREGTVVDIKPNRIYLMDVAHAGDRLVAVGERGFALLSDDAGKTWKAVGTPVNRTLTGVAFNGDKLGVAVGHGGMLVRTEDGGSTWTAVAMDDAMGESLLGVTALGDGRFAAYGAFGMYFDTQDGGQSWAKRTIIDEYFEAHISQVVLVDGKLWLVGEAGTLATCDEQCTAFVAVPSPYTGSFFGMLVAKDGALILYGMRGSVFRSADAGVTWTRVEVDTTASFNGGRVLSDGSVVLVGNAGLVARSTDNGQTFELEWSKAGRGFSSLAEVPGGLVVVGEGGAAILDPASLIRK